MLSIEKNLRFIDPQNWHITISFLGYQNSAEVPKIMEAVKEIASAALSPKVIFDKITYGPDTYHPRMVWLKTTNETSLNLGKIKKNLEDNLEKSGIKFKRENRQFSGHITLARMRFYDKKLKLPIIDEGNNFEFYAKSLDVMESALKRGGAEYSLLGKFDFKDG